MLNAVEMNKDGNDKLKVTFRRATLADYHAVLEISKDIYDGWDYIPAKYSKLLQDPNIVALVIELDGKVVSVYHLFSSQCVVNV